MRRLSLAARAAIDRIVNAFDDPEKLVDTITRALTAGGGRVSLTSDPVPRSRRKGRRLGRRRDGAARRFRCR